MTWSASSATAAASGFPPKVEPCDRVVRLLREHAFAQQALADLARARDVGIDLGAGPQAAAAHGFERRALDRAQPLEHMGAEHAALLHQPFVADDVQRFEADGGGERVAAEGGAVRAGREHVHQFATADQRRHRQHAAAERLAEDQPVGLDILVLERKPSAGAAET